MSGTLDKAFGYQGDNMRLPVPDLAAALPFYQNVLGFTVVSRSETPHRSAVLSRDAVQIGLAENGGDPTQDGCAFHVSDVESLLAQFTRNGLQRERADFDVEQHGGSTFRVFYVVAPDGLCYWFGERQASQRERGQSPFRKHAVHEEPSRGDPARQDQVQRRRGQSR